MTAQAPSRWSEARYASLDIPSYVPPEALLHEQGQLLRALQLRVLACDLQRMLVTNTCEYYFVNLPLQPEYDAQGNRTNTPRDVVGEKRLRAIDDLGKLLRTYVDRVEHATGRGREITRKIYLTKEQVESGAWGAIIGARGTVHQQLEKETRCHIVLAGRGITNTLKDSSPAAAALALEEPHIRLTATSEADLQAAAERVEWIMSDDPEAVEFCERNRRRTAQIEGRYDPRTWVTVAERKQQQQAAAAATTSGSNNNSGGGGGVDAAAAAQPQTDAELDEFLEDL